jgi:DNA polymerase-3 subunit delta'
VDGFLTVGQPAAVTAVRGLLGQRSAHAVLLVGPPGVGKMSLALDLAAALLCEHVAGGVGPCRACRGCRMVEHGNHADLHLLAPTGAGGQIQIGNSDHPEPGTIRALVGDLALLPVEGGARVAIVRDAQAMNDAAQSALLKTLEEPPDNTTLILCADDDEQLLPTIRSRCARVRLGIVDARSIEQLITDRALADPPTAARLARLTAGRAGLAVAYAAAPDAVVIRAELVRRLLDLLAARPAERLAAAKDLQARALALARLLAAPAPAAADAAPPAKGRGKGAAKGTSAAGVGAAPAAASEDSADEPADAEPGAGSKVSPAERRLALRTLVELWRDLARDLALVERGAIATVRDVGLLEELEAASRALPTGAAAAALAGLVRAGEMLDGNVTPELVLDMLLLRWPHRAPTRR